MILDESSCKFVSEASVESSGACGLDGASKQALTLPDISGGSNQELMTSGTCWTGKSCFHVSCLDDNIRHLQWVASTSILLLHNSHSSISAALDE